MSVKVGQTMVTVSGHCRRDDSDWRRPTTSGPVVVSRSGHWPEVGENAGPS